VYFVDLPCVIYNSCK